MSHVFKGQVKIEDVQKAFDSLVDKINSQISNYNEVVRKGETVDYTKGSATLAPYNYTLSVGGLKQVMRQLKGTTIGCNIFRSADNKLVVSNGIHFGDNYTIDRLPVGVINESGEGSKAETKGLVFSGDGKSFHVNQTSFGISWIDNCPHIVYAERYYQSYHPSFAESFIPGSYVLFPYKVGQTITFPAGKSMYVMLVKGITQDDGYTYYYPSYICTDQQPGWMVNNAYLGTTPYSRSTYYDQPNEAAYVYYSGNWSNVTEMNIPLNNGKALGKDMISFQIQGEDAKFTQLPAKLYDSRVHRNFVSSTVASNEDEPTATHVLFGVFDTAANIDVDTIEIRDTDLNTDFSRFNSYEEFDAAYPNIFTFESSAGAFNVYYDKSKNAYTTSVPTNGYFIRNCNVHRKTPYLNTGDFLATNIKGLDIYSGGENSKVDTNRRPDPKGDRFIIPELGVNNAKNRLFLCGREVSWMANQGASTSQHAFNRAKIFVPDGVELDYTYENPNEDWTKFAEAIIKKNR